MKKTCLIVLFFLLIATTGFGQEQLESVPVIFFEDNEVQNVDSSFIIQFRASDSLVVAHPKKGKLKIPDFAERDSVQLSFVYEDSTIFAIEVSIKDYLVYSENVSWVIGIDSIPFDKEYLEAFPVWKTTTKVFFWNIIYDKIDDLLVIPLDGSPEIFFPTIEEGFD